jgi:hypothetical protein
MLLVEGTSNSQEICRGSWDIAILATKALFN